MANPIRARQITITNEDVDGRASLGQAPARNQLSRAGQALEHYEAERIATVISTMDNPYELNRIGQAAAARMRQLGALPERRRRRLTDRALLRLYLELTPSLLSLAVVMPLVIWGGWRLAGSAWFGSRFAELHGVLSQSCPPTCAWQHLAMWAALGGVSLLLAAVVSHGLRKRLLIAAHG